MELAEIAGKKEITIEKKRPLPSKCPFVRLKNEYQKWNGHSDRQKVVLMVQLKRSYARTKYSNRL